MPRFLDIDYLTEIINYQKQILNSMLLDIPVHLEQVECYVHKGMLPDPSYRKPWLKARAMDTDMFQNRDGIDKDLELLQNSDIPEIEPLYSVSGKQLHSYLRPDEFVPSSNPSSQSSIEDEILLSIAEQYDAVVGEEIFCKQELSLYSSSEGQDLLLEEVLCDHALQCGVSSIPHIDRLLNKLQVKIVKDPFLDESGNPITQESLFRNDKMYGPQQTSQPMTDTVCGEELFECEVIKWEPPTTLEEDLVLEYADRSEQISLDHYLPGSERFKEVLKGMQKMEEDVTVDIADNDEDLRKLSLRNSQSRIAETLLHFNTGDSRDEEALFLELNDHDSVSDVRTTVSVSLLESPLVFQMLACMPDDLKTLWNICTPNQLSPDEHRDLLTKSQQEQIEEDAWQCEKYFSDITSMRLSEPLIKIDYLKHLSPSEVIKRLHLKTLEYDCYLELELSWDPVANTKASEPRDGIETLFTSNIDDTTYGSDFCETFMKYTFEDKECDIYIEKNKEILIQPGPSTSFEMVCSSLEKYHSENKKVIPHGDINPLTDTLASVSQWDADAQIDNFFMMATGSIHLPSKKKCLPWQTSAKPCPSTNDIPPKSSAIARSNTSSGQLDTSITSGHSVSSGGLKPCTKSTDIRIVNIRPSGIIYKVLCMIEEVANPLIARLSSEDLLPVAQQFVALKPNITHFMLKQHKKSCQDLGQTEVTLVHSTMLCLHILTCVFDLALNVSLPAAVFHLAQSQEKNQHLTGMVYRLREKLFQEHYNQQQMKQLHPKIATICKEIITYLKQEKSKLKPHSAMILIILKREENYLIQNLVDVLDKVDGIKTNSLKGTRPHTTEDILSLLKQYSCIICGCADLKDDFPWHEFSLVIEYEHSPQEREYLILCDQKHIKFIGLVALCQNAEHNTSLYGTVEINKSVNLILIGSQKLTGFQELLKSLETRLDLTIYERDYRKIDHCVHYADLILDQCHGIVLELMPMLDSDGYIDVLIENLMHISLQYTHCWLILMQDQNKLETQCLQNNSNIIVRSKLHGLIHIINKRIPEVQIKVFYSKSIVETSSLIKQLIEVAYQQAKCPNIDDWAKRTWLNHAMSKHEKFLLTIPCMNSISAQMLLTLDPLCTLFTMTYDSLAKICSALPPHSVKFLYEYITVDHSMDQLTLTVPRIITCNQALYPEIRKHSLSPDRVHGQVDTSDTDTDQYEDDIIETLDLLPSQPGLNEYEKSALCGHEQGQRCVLHREKYVPYWLDSENCMDLNGANMACLRENEDMVMLSDDHCVTGDLQPGTEVGLKSGFDSEGICAPNVRDMRCAVPTYSGIIAHSNRCVDTASYNYVSHPASTTDRDVYMPRCSTQTTAEYRCSKTRAIAPVTPRVRHSLETWSVADDSYSPEVDRYQVYEGQVTERDRWHLYEQDSPPMEVVSPIQPLQPCSQQISSFADTGGLDLSTDGLSNSSQPTKKRRLVYECVPGNKGQTRLSFI